MLGFNIRKQEGRFDKKKVYSLVWPFQPVLCNLTSNRVSAVHHTEQQRSSLFLAGDNAASSATNPPIVPVARDREKRVASLVRLERDCVGVERRLDHLQAGVLVDEGQAHLNMFARVLFARTVM